MFICCGLHTESHRPKPNSFHDMLASADYVEQNNWNIVRLGVEISVSSTRKHSRLSCHTHKNYIRPSIRRLRLSCISVQTFTSLNKNFYCSLSLNLLHNSSQKLVKKLLIWPGTRARLYVVDLSITGPCVCKWLTVDVRVLSFKMNRINPTNASATCKRVLVCAQPSSWIISKRVKENKQNFFPIEPFECVCSSVCKLVYIYACMFATRH